MVKIVGQDNKTIVMVDGSKTLIDPIIILQGKDGKDGLDGAAGPEGMPGRDGVDGRDGRDGIDGKDGKDGISYWIEYDKKTNTLYFKNDGGKKSPEPIKLPSEAKGWGFSAGCGRGGVTAQSDWLQKDKHAVDYIKNKAQQDELPSADKKYVGRIVQYTGETTEDYTHGYIYECVENEGVFYWKEISVQSGGSSSSSLATLTDVSLSSPANGQFLSYNGTNWTNTTLNALQNTATGTNSLTILGTESTAVQCVNIGYGSSTIRNGVAIGYNAKNTGSYNVSIGYNSSCSANLGFSVALGGNAKTTASYAIQIGYGTNSEANSVYMSTSSANNWKVLGSDGKIPDDRITKQTTLSSSSTDNQVPSAKCVYDLVGNVEALINAL